MSKPNDEAMTITRPPSSRIVPLSPDQGQRGPPTMRTLEQEMIEIEQGTRPLADDPIVRAEESAIEEVNAMQTEDGANALLSLAGSKV